MQLLKHLANAMQRAEGFVLGRALVVTSTCIRATIIKFVGTNFSENWTKLIANFAKISICQQKYNV